jgi:excisionase family DNA binding protein
MQAKPEETANTTPNLTAQEVADRLRIHWRTVHNAILRGELDAIQLDGSAGYRISEAAVQAWLEKRRARPAVSEAS